MVLPGHTNSRRTVRMPKLAPVPKLVPGNLDLRPVEGSAATIRTPGSACRLGETRPDHITGGIVPVAGQRDPEQTRAALTRWLGRQMPGASDVEITDLVVPQSSGFSNETFLFDGRVDRGRAARVRTTSCCGPSHRSRRSSPRSTCSTQQYRSMKMLGEHTDVPVARVRWAEPDDVGARPTVLRHGPPVRPGAGRSSRRTPSQAW